MDYDARTQLVADRRSAFMHAAEHHRLVAPRSDQRQGRWWHGLADRIGTALLNLRSVRRRPVTVAPPSIPGQVLIGD